MPMAVLASLLDASMDGDLVSRLKFERALKDPQYQPSAHAAGNDEHRCMHPQRPARRMIDPIARAHVDLSKYQQEPEVNAPPQRL